VKVLGIVLAVLALAALGVFAWGILRPSRPAARKPSATYARQSVRVLAARGSGTAPTPDGPSPLDTAPTPASAPAEPAGPLCDRSWGAADAPTFELPPGRLMRSGADPPAGAWTWVSLWAAWCKPCKHEMPLLAAWAAKAAWGSPRITLSFPSVDDDERELRRFLGGKGRTLPGRFTWLQAEADRERLYSALGVPNPPTLPLQAIVDGRGRLRCVRVGSISAADLERAPAALGWGQR